MFHPGLVRSFEYVVSAQLDEFLRLYGDEPTRVDGHHHMHLCSNVLHGKLLRFRTSVRRNFSFQPGERKAFVTVSIFNNRQQTGPASWVPRIFSFSLPPLDPPDRLQRIFSLANEFTVEVETHPIRREEYRLSSE